MKFEYELKFSDYFLYSLSHTFHSSVTQITYVILSVFMSYASTREWPRFLLSVPVMYGLLWLTLAIFTVLTLAAGKNKNLLTKHTLVFDESGIEVETEFAKGRLLWKGVQKVARRAGAMAIYAQAHAAILIPMRVLGGADQYKNLRDYIEERRETV